MTSQAFEAVLSEPDNDASNLQLYELVAARSFTGETLPTVAEHYLHAFCGGTSSLLRRRWIGIALAGMISASPTVVAHLKNLRQKLQGLGAVILSNTEREETRIIAGLIIRQALQQSIEYGSFWISDKVKDSAPNFPANSDLRWMSNFQTFLDTLGDLALANPITDPSILYPISLVASDGFIWRDSNEGFPIALIQAGILTVIAPDADLQEIQFVDIPVSHIHSTQSKRSTLYDSQARTTEHEPWDLVLTLKAEPWTYRLNTSRRTGNEVTLLFQHCGDAKECECCIKEHQKGKPESISSQPPAAHPRMSRSSPIDCSRTSQPQTNDILTHQELQGIPQAHQPPRTNPQQRTVSSSNFIDVSRLPLPSRPPHIEPHSEQKGSSAHKDQSPQSHQTRSSGGPVQAAQLRVAGEQDKTKPAQQRPSAKPAQKENKTKPTQEPHSPSSNDILNRDNPLEQTDTTHSTSNKSTYSTGRLPKVSQSAKQKVLKQLRAQTDVFEIPPEKSTGTEIGKKAGSNAASSSKPTSQKPLQGSKAAEHGATGGMKGNKSQAKRKADDDDDFMPEEIPKKRLNAKRKSGSDAAIADKKPRKNARIELAEDAGSSRIGTRSATIRTAVQHAAQAKVKKVSKPRKTKTGISEKPSSPITSSRHSLIGGLLGSQNPSKTSTVPFKKPKLPDRAVQPPSTPTPPRTRAVEPLKRLKTPLDVRKRPNNEPLPTMSSSPLVGNANEGGSDWVQHTAVDAEILSSNSKPVPASPNAESTAISGHADREDVDFEKRRGEIQTAKSDPFQQRREGQRATSFTRRLTGEDPANHKHGPKEGVSYCMPMEITSSGSEDTTLVVTDQPLPLPTPWQRKEFSSVKMDKRGEPPLARVTGPRKPVTSAKENRLEATEESKYVRSKKVADMWTSQPSKQKISPTLRQSGVHAEGITNLNAINRAPIKRVPAQTKETATVHEDGEREFEMEDSILTATQQVIDDTQIEHPVQEYDEAAMGDEATLINSHEDEQSASKLEASHIHFHSSPPIRGLSSSHSSTSAEPEPLSEPSLPTSEVEEMEWEASLQPHQRALHDLLIRTSKRVLRHVVDNETAVTDIAEIFARDGEHVLDSLLQRFNDYNHVFQDMENKKKGLQKELQAVAKQLVKERRRIGSVV